MDFENFYPKIHEYPIKISAFCTFLPGSLQIFAKKFTVLNNFYGNISVFYAQKLCFRDEYNKNNNKVLFLVVTDDIFWARSTWRNVKDVAVVAQGPQNREVDLAILTKCQHTIMSTGTFSWWAAYLAGGDAVFYEFWPMPGSALSLMLNRDDFFLPHWIPML